MARKWVEHTKKTNKVPDKDPGNEPDEEPDEGGVFDASIDKSVLLKHEDTKVSTNRLI